VCARVQVSYDRLMQHATRLMMSTSRRNSSVSAANDHTTAAAAIAAAAAAKVATAAPITVGHGAASASVSSAGCSSGILAGLALQDHINALYSSLSDVHRATFVEVSTSAHSISLLHLYT
jgi:hypothetical protein